MTRALLAMSLGLLVAVGCVHMTVVASDVTSREGEPSDAATPEPSPLRGATVGAYMPRPTSFNYTSGTGAATITVPTGQWVSGVTICASSGDAGLASIGVAGLSLDGSTILDGAVQGNTITVPAGIGCLTVPGGLAGGLGSLGPGSTIVVSAASYTITYEAFSGSF